MGVLNNVFCRLSRSATTIRWARWSILCSLGFLIAAAYALACLAFFLLQNHELFPGRYTHGTAHAIVSPSPEYELVHFTTAGGDPIVAIFGCALDTNGQPLPDSAARPTILYFYCNDICIADSFAEFRRFRRLGFNVLIPDYPGFGMSGGTASEHSLCACADAAFEYLYHRPDVDRSRIVSLGWSIGAAVATDLAAHRPVMCLVTFSAFTSWNDEMHRHNRWLPTALLDRARFENEAKFRTLHCPVFIAHGRHDRTVPLSMAMRLGDAYGVMPMVIESDHNIFVSPNDDLMRAVQKFINGCQPVH